MKVDCIKQIRRGRRKVGIRKKVVGTPLRPRLSVYRSLTHIYAQIIDDIAGHTLVAASSMKDGPVRGDDKSGAEMVGKQLAEKAIAAGIKQV